MIAASLAQRTGYTHAFYPALTGLSPVRPLAAGLGAGLLAGMINGSLIAFTKIPPFIAALGTMVSARGVASWYTNGEPIGNLTEDYAAIGSGLWPWPRFSRSRWATRAMANSPMPSAPISWPRACPVAMWSGTFSSCIRFRAITGQAGMGFGFELDAIAAAVIGGTSLAGGVGRMTGTVIGTLILGVLTSGFTFLNVDAHYQEIIKGIVIVSAVIVDQYRLKQRKKSLTQFCGSPPAAAQLDCGRFA